MDKATALRTLQRLGKPGTVAIYARHGVTGPCWGVSYADLGKLVKQAGVDHDLALGLWRSGVHDARVMATKVADPAVMTAAELDGWVRDADNYVLVDAVAGLAARSGVALDLVKRWIADAAEWVGAAGYGVAAVLAVDGRLPATLAASLLTKIQKGIQKAKNRTRHSMNNALIAIGGSMADLRSAALAVADAIGVVEVDHGETGCKTPHAASYIQKMVDHQAKRTRVTGARMAARAPAKAGKARAGKAGPKKAAGAKGGRQAAARPR